MFRRGNMKAVIFRGMGLEYNDESWMMKLVMFRGTGIEYNHESSNVQGARLEDKHESSNFQGDWVRIQSWIMIDESSYVQGDGVRNHESSNVQGGQGQKINMKAVIFRGTGLEYNNVSWMMKLVMFKGDGVRIQSWKYSVPG
jgi:hypothetical protein